MKQLAGLFLTFAKMGCMTFGGGYAMLPILEREIIQKKRWTTTDEVLQYYTIAQITPGVIAVNVATFIGYKRKGVAGGIAATLGFVLPSVTAIIVISLVLRNFAELPVVQHCFSGIRLAVSALILDTLYKLIAGIVKKDAGLFKTIVSLALFAASFTASVVFSANPALIVVCAGLCGFLFFGDRGGGAGA